MTRMPEKFNINWVVDKIIHVPIFTGILMQIVTTFWS